jgi:hypothetical protein
LGIEAIAPQTPLVGHAVTPSANFHYLSIIIVKKLINTKTTKIEIALIPINAKNLSF